ncbi:hypothetical protein CVT26_014777 [Gymnopilus dilepis]|uniref:DEAD/DEAH box helicase domain-containing protein n=1 Tax=Gymnopilus dilepis TaxID=231916 RepID=A0A409W3Z1_9AGAR|nr:hypothetical protein CVT26_014777 [Gymnopilus dilepis]
MTTTSSHNCQRACWYRNLQVACKKAATKKNYNSVKTRAQLSTLFCACHGSDPRDWQLDVTEALLLRLDCVVIAGTGAGKTMPFMMPLLLDEVKKTVVTCLAGHHKV